LTSVVTQSRLDRRLARGAIWSYGAHFAGRLVVFLGLAIVARLLSPQEFGLFAMATVVANFLELVRDFGLRSATMCLSTSDNRGAVYSTAFTLNVLLGIILAALHFAVAPFVGAFYGDSTVSTLMQVLAAYFLLVGASTVPDAMLRMRFDFRARVWPDVGGPLIRYAVAIAFALHGFGAWSLIAGQLAGVLVTTVLAFVVAGWLPRLGYHATLARQLLALSGKLTAVQVISGLLLNLDYVFVGRFLGSEVLGIYTLAFKLPDTTILALANVAGTLILPVYIEKASHPSKLREGYLQALSYLSLILIPAGSGLCVLAPVLVPLLFGERWSAAVPVVQLLALSSLLHGLLFSVGQLFIAAGRPGLLVVAHLAWAVVLIPLLFLAAQVDIIAVAWAHLFGIVLYASVKVALVSRLLDLKAQDVISSLRNSVLASAAMIVALSGLLKVGAGVPIEILGIGGVLLGALVYVLSIAFLDVGTFIQAREVIAAPRRGGQIA
jgi:O-antigen/teichoic acid export membrane protein